ncbi:MAG: DUF882 domain-containing protein [Alphaproteobacteria bacterium]|nr:DUF882 domain-containing protein [Alphaproteobacteria bacterium]
MKKKLILIVTWVLCACGSSENYGLHYREVSGRGMPKTQPDRDPVRRIVLEHPHSKEAINVVYFHDGHYDAVAMKKINFLMRDRHENIAGDIDPELVDYLVDIRKRLALPSHVPFQILSGYRSSRTNATLARTNGNVAKESLHMHGWAVDFRVQGVNGRAICEIAKTMQRGGVAYYPNDNHLHVDLGNIRTWHEAKN